MRYMITSSDNVIIMRTIVDIPEEKLKALDAYCKALGISRAEGVRRGVDKILEQELAEEKSKRLARVLDETYGAWKDLGIGDAVEYQRALRAEWDNRGWDEKK